MTRPSQAGTTRRGTMSRRRSLAFVPVAVGVLLAALGTVSVSAAPPTGTNANEVIHWNQVAAIHAHRDPGPPNGGAPPAFQINMGDRAGRRLRRSQRDRAKEAPRIRARGRDAGAKASVNAAVATAAYDVLSNLVSTAPERAPFPGRAGLLTDLATQRDTSLAAISQHAFKKQGIQVGHLAAKAMLDSRVGDGRFGPSQWVSSTGVGHWQPLSIRRRAADPRSDTVGGRREAVLPPKLIAVP